MKPTDRLLLVSFLLSSVLIAGCGPGEQSAQPAVQPTVPEPSPPAAAPDLTQEQVDNIVYRSYPYVAMYNVNNKFAIKQGGWDTCDADTELKDHTMREIARPNNDTLYIGCMLDLRNDAIVLMIPAFESDYASLMVTGYDHHVNIPLASRRGDFGKPEKMLLFSARTRNYDGGQVEGIDHVFEATGDFISAVFRVMPHFSEPERFERIKQQMQAVEAVTLTEYQGGQALTPKPVDFPPVGKTDFDTFENNLLEVMQFVFNHTTFDPANPDDQAVLETYAPLGVRPGQRDDSTDFAQVDGARFRAAAEVLFNQWISALADQDTNAALRPRVFQPKGKSDLEAVVAVSIIGPIGIPQEEAVYPQIESADGKPINALHDYVVRMTAAELPPAQAFWSLTLYDQAQGFFIPNDRKKYSVGLNGGMKLNAEGGIEIYVAAEQPEGVPEENWLPIERKDLELSLQLRAYVPDLEKMETWVAPKAEML